MSVVDTSDDVSETEVKRRDAIANKGNTKGRFIVRFYRIANRCHRNRNRPLWRLISPVVIGAYKAVCCWILGVEIDPATRIGPGLAVYHGQALVINPGAVIGSGCVLRQSTTIGNKIRKGRSPRLGNNVQIGTHCVILGDIEIGNNVVVGAGAVVITDVPDGSIVAGNPAKVIGAISHLSARGIDDA